jgi:hypothetical protein
MSTITDRLIDSRAVRMKFVRGDREPSDMTLYRWIRKGVCPPPDLVIERKRYWRESTIDRAFGLRSKP